MTVPTAATAGKDAAEDHLAAIEQLYEEAMAHIAEFVEASSPPPPADVDTAADAVVPVNAKPSPAQQIAAA